MFEFFTYEGCGSNMYGGFNGSVCQSCPMNSTNERGYSISSCECVAGYTGTNGGSCMGKALYNLYNYLFIP